MAENEVLERIWKFHDLGLERSVGLGLGMGDDAALWRPRRGYETVLTCDWFLEGTHFLRDKHPADSVGWKCVARAESDVAGMGGEPRCFLLSLALPAKSTGRWLNEFLAGVKRASRRFACAMAGGDTTRRDQILINVAVVGEVKRGHALRRDGARAGDAIFVTGRLGEAELGLRRLRKTRGMARSNDAGLRKHLYPKPRLEVGQWLAERRLASAAMDLSDGLSSDLPRICAASGVGAVVNEAGLPVATGIARKEAVRLALHGGDDYELLFTVKARNAKKIPRMIRGVRLTQIGEIVRGRGVRVRVADGKLQRLEAMGWDAFRK